MYKRQLCDREFMVMTLLRSHVDKRKNLKIMGKRRYPVERFRAFRMPTREAWEDALKPLQTICKCAPGVMMDVCERLSQFGESVSEE